jgi:chromosomal replication initiator protein
MPVDKKELWITMLTRLRETIPHSKFITFFNKTVILDVDKELLIIGVPLEMSFNWIAQHCKTELLKIAQDVIPQVTAINLQIDNSLNNQEDTRHIGTSLFEKQSSPKGRKLPGKGEVKMGEGLTSKTIDQRYSLDNFIVGPENRLAHAASSAVSAAPGLKYNPLFIYGKTGVGKTHLLMGIANEVSRRHPQKLIIYTTSEAFGNEYIKALGARKMDQFNNRYRKVDLLIVDDIQFLFGKNKTEEVFFHTFNALYDAGKQVIVASDRPPKELDELDKRLTTRLGMGMIADIQLPDFETRLAILHEKIREHQSIIDPDVVTFIAKNVEGTVRELEGVLMQAIAEAELENSTPTVRSVERVLRKLDKNHDIVDGVNALIDIPRVTKEEDIIKIVSNHYNVEPEEVTGKSRKQEIALARQVAMYIMKRTMNHSLEHIGTVFGGRNHTTAMHSVNNITERVEKDNILSKDINALKKEMGLV